jgi:large subunit ribosomal protein L13
MHFGGDTTIAVAGIVSWPFRLPEWALAMMSSARPWGRFPQIRWLEVATDSGASFDTAPPLAYNHALFRKAVKPMKTFSAKPHEVKRDWFLIDAADKVLGRVAVEVARRLRGKHKVIYTPHVDTGDFIVVVNAAKLRVTGDKADDKTYYRHSGYPGGISQTSFGKMQARFPGRALEKAVKGMLPKGPLGYAMFKKLKVYADGEHPHVAQQPKALEI